MRSHEVSLKQALDLAARMEVSLSAEAETTMARAATLRAFHVPTSAEASHFLRVEEQVWR